VPRLLYIGTSVVRMMMMSMELTQGDGASNICWVDPALIAVPLDSHATYMRRISNLQLVAVIQSSRYMHCDTWCG